MGNHSNYIGFTNCSDVQRRNIAKVHKFTMLVALLIVVLPAAASNGQRVNINVNKNICLPLKLNLVCGKNGFIYASPCDVSWNVGVACKACRCQKTWSRLNNDCICEDGNGPVCGKNGIQYGNACSAVCSKAEVACKGPCPCPYR